MENNFGFNTQFLLDQVVDYLVNEVENNKPDALPTRDGYGKAIVDIATKDTSVVALNADLEGSVRLAEFTEQFPERSIQVGVSEQNMASVATGLALYGKIPFLSSFAAFSPGLNFSQIRLACYSDANIKVASSHYGLNIGEDGVSAQMLEDVAMMRAVPKLLVITPVDYNQTYQAVWEVYKYKGPVYIRFTRNKFPIFMKEDSHFELGKAQVLKEGSQVTIFVTGSLAFRTLEASAILAKEGIDVRVVNIHTIKPIDVEEVVNSAKFTGKVLTVEEHQVNGGMGSAIAEVLSTYHPTRMEKIGVNDEFGETGSPDNLLLSKGLTKENIISKVRSLIGQ